MPFSPSPWKKSCFAAGFLVAVVLPSSHAAVTSLWTGGSGDWSDAGNWSAGVPQRYLDGDFNPIEADRIRIDNGGTATISGAFVWGFADADAILGDLNSGFLRIENGGGLIAGTYPLQPVNDFILGNQAGATGGITVSGANSSLEISIDSGSGYGAVIGNAGTGYLTIEDHGSANASGTVTLGRQVGSTGALNVGLGSFGAEKLTVGGLGTASVTMVSGSLVQAWELVIAESAGSTGLIAISGGLANWGNYLGGHAVVGQGGTGSVSLEDYGYMQNITTTLGQLAGASGEVTVQTHGDFVSTEGFIIGDAGQGRVVIQGTGRAETAAASDYPGSTPVANLPGWVIGNQTGSIGEVIATGMGDTWNVYSAGDVVVGKEGTGTLTVGDRATIRVDRGIIRLGEEALGSGTLNVGTGGGEGYVRASEIRGGAGQAIINFNHNNSYNPYYEFNPRITGSTTVNQIAGTTVLLGKNTYTGTTTISGGELQVMNRPSYHFSHAGTLEGTPEIIVTSGGVFSVFGDQSVTNRINDAANLTLDGGSFHLNGLSEGTTTAAGLGEFNLLSTSTIDFGNPMTAGILAFAGVGVHASGAVLQIANWNGIMTLGGGTAQLLFQGSGSDFSSAYDQSDVQFFGYNAGYLIVQGMDFYEVVPFAIPEPGSTSLLFMGGAAFWLLRLRSRQRRTL